MDATTTPVPGGTPESIRPKPAQYRWAAGEVPCQVLFQRPPARTRRASCPGSGLSSDCYVSVLAGCRLWMPSWQVGQTIKVLRRFLAMSCVHDGCGCPG